MTHPIARRYPKPHPRVDRGDPPQADAARTQPGGIPVQDVLQACQQPADHGRPRRLPTARAEARGQRSATPLLVVLARSGRFLLAVEVPWPLATAKAGLGLTERLPPVREPRTAPSVQVGGTDRGQPSGPPS